MCLAPSGCLSDLTRPPGLDDGGIERDGGGGADGAPATRCDPAQPFEAPVLLTTTPATINSDIQEGWARVSDDDLTLYFVRAVNHDVGRFLEGGLFFIRRDDPGSLFDADSLTNESEFNPGANNEAPYLAPDRSRLFYSNGADHIFFSDRDGTEGLFPSPGATANFSTTDVRDMHPYLVGNDTLYFTSSRGGSPDKLQAYRATRNGEDFDAPEPLGITTEVPGQQIAPVASSDHRVVFFSADGTLYRAVRGGEGTFDTVVLADDLNGGSSYPGSLSRDDCVLYFHSDRSGGDFDIWMARATVVLDPP